MYSLLFCFWKRVFAMTSVFSWQNSISLCPASFCNPRPNLPVTPDVSWLPTFAFQSPMMKRTSFLVLVLEGHVCLHRMFNFSFFSISSWGTDLDYYDIEWFALEMNRDHSVVFEIPHNYCISDFLLTRRPTAFFSKGFLPTILDMHNKDGHNKRQKWYGPNRSRRY